MRVTSLRSRVRRRLSAEARNAADGGQRPAVLAVQLVNAIAMDDQFALLAARQVEVPHQAIDVRSAARIPTSAGVDD
jgi:hypothetical protein